MKADENELRFANFFCKTEFEIYTGKRELPKKSGIFDFSNFKILTNKLFV